MELPQYVIDFLQTNYYIPTEQLNLPFDQMPASLRNLILTQCLNAEKGALTPKSEEEIYKQARKRFQADIDSDTKPLARSTVDNFAKNHQVLIGLTGLAERQAPRNDFSQMAILLAAKRMASDEYAQTPKTLTNFMAVQREVETELEIKYYAARYFDAHPQQPENDADYHRRTIGDIAEIAHMVRDGKQTDIAGRFGLPDSESDRADFKGATLSFAGAELQTFSDALEKRVKDSPFVRRVRDLDASFKQKYPKTYIAAKLVGNTAAAMTLGRVFSAYKAVAGIHAMRKDFAEYNRTDTTEKKSLWDFVRSPKGRQKLMEIGQNTLRVIPGMRAVGVALGAVKNSDNLRNSIKELRDGGSSKSAWLKVGGAAVGLLAVSAVAAYANDDVANAVNDCISHSFGAAKDAVEQVVDTVSTHFAPQADSTPSIRLNDLLARMNTQSAADAGIGIDDAATTDVDASPTGNTNITYNDGKTSFATMHVGKDGISFNGSINQVADKTRDGVTVTTVNYDTKSMNVHAAVTDNQSGTRLVVDNNSAGQKVGVVSEDGCKNVDVLNEKGKGANIYAHADKVELKDGTVLRNNSVDLRAGHAATQINHTDGGQTGIRVDKGSLNVSHNEGLSYNQMHVGKDGISFNGSINQVADKTRDGVTVTTVNYDTKSMNVHAAVTDNQSGTRLVVDNNSAGQKVGVVSEDGCKNVDVLNEKGKGANIYAHADKVELKDGTVLRNNSVDLRAGHAATQINHADGGQTGVRIDKNSANISHNKGGVSNQMHIDKDGKITFNGMVTQSADRSKSGVTVTALNYDTKNMNVHAAVTDNKTGNTVVVDRNSSGIGIRSQDERGQTKFGITIGRDGVNIRGKSGKTVNVGKVLKMIKGFVR